MKTTAFLAYVPVLHQGYLQFFQTHPEVKKLYLIDDSLVQDFRQLVKDIRALPTETIKKAIKSLGIFDEVQVIGKETINQLNDSDEHFIVPDEDEMRQIVSQYLFEAYDEDRITKDSVFLRWDSTKSKTPQEINPDEKISTDEFDQKVIKKLDEFSKNSSDWWRQVSAALVQNNHVIWYGRNTHLPHEMQAYSDGDPRANFHKGEMIEATSAIHAESYLIAEAAKDGFKTEGVDLYVTTFPCPVCAKLIAQAGIRKVFYSEGYAMLDGETVLKSKGVEIIKVEK